jgi:hypothetical protein
LARSTSSLTELFAKRPQPNNGRPSRIADRSRRVDPSTGPHYHHDLFLGGNSKPHWE